MKDLRKKNKLLNSGIPLDEIALIMSDKDNVAITKTDIAKNTLVSHRNTKIKILESIPSGHRFSLVKISKDDLVKQYGWPFGFSKGIEQGGRISKYNVTPYHTDYKKMLDDRGLWQTERVGVARTPRKYSQKTFLGYARRSGKVGTRNYYCIVPTSLCASDVAAKLALELNKQKAIRKRYKNVDGVVAAAHTEGCGCNDGTIINRLLLTLRNTILHPNVGGALVIDLGCEKTNIKMVSDYFGDLSKYHKPIDYISIQDLGGTKKALVKGRAIIQDRLEQVNSTKREKVSIRYLVIGTECGASDSFSGITANPVIGLTVDKIISAGGSAILTETPEMIGAEACLLRRMVSLEVAKKFVEGMEYYQRLASALGVSMDGNFVPGNERGGLVNLTLKSLGAILKGGSTQIVDFIDYAQQIQQRGLSIMNGPGNDLESMTGIVASGANIILFSTGMGTTEGNLLVPVIKLSTRTEVYRKMKEDIDFNAGILLDRSISLDELSENLLDLTIEVGSGRKTWSEIWEKRSFQIWSAGKLSL